MNEAERLERQLDQEDRRLDIEESQIESWVNTSNNRLYAVIAVVVGFVFVAIAYLDTLSNHH